MSFMNLNGDEQRIQRLFRDMSGDDRRRTPQFASVLATAQSRLSRPHRRAGSLRLAIAAVLLCVAMLVVVFAVMKSSKPHGPATNEQISVRTEPEAKPDVTESPQPGVKATNVNPGVAQTNRARRRRNSTSLAAAMKSLSSWQSPTASLLHTPVDESLRSLPRLGESLQTIKRFSPDQFN